MHIKQVSANNYMAWRLDSSRSEESRPKLTSEPNPTCSVFESTRRHGGRL
jgi:hypothetical protein